MALSVNPTGQIKYPFRAQALRELIDRRAGDRQQLLQLDIEGREKENDYVKNLRDLSQKFQSDKLGTLNTNASRGTAFSSAYGRQSSELSKFFNQSVGDLRQQRKTFRNADLSQRALIKTGYNDFLRGLVQQQSENDVQYGSDPGYSRVKPTEVKVGLGSIKPHYTTPSNQAVIRAIRQRYGF